jgi:hypothetical protein
MPRIIAGGGLPDGGVRGWLRWAWHRIAPGVPPQEPIRGRNGRVVAIGFRVLVVLLAIVFVLARLL